MTANVAPPTEKLITEEELLRMSAGDTWYEVVNGEVVPVSAAGFLHAIVISNIYDILKPYVKENNLGYVITDGLHCILFPEEGGVRGSRIPDVAYISHERIPENFDFNRPFPGAPDLAVEVVSPTEGEDTLLAKVRDYLNAGSQQVWVVHPATKEAHQYRRDTPEIIRVYMGDDQIEADDLFPGLGVLVGAFFEVV